MLLKKIILLIGIVASLQTEGQQTFTNPLLPTGADPWCIYNNGYYYYTNTTGRNITLWKTDNISNLDKAEKKVVFTPPPGTSYSNAVWAPELHLLNNKWYIYFAANNQRVAPHYMWVLENDSADPLQDNWKFKCKLQTPDDKWSIDGTVFDDNGQLYFLWSGWEGDINRQQNIYIAAMDNPWTIRGERILLSSPKLDWEMHGDLKNDKGTEHVNVNEAPQVLKHDNKILIIYSASGCWTDYYALGMLTTNTGSNFLDSATWTKSTQPVFKQSPENSVYGTGHNCFFKSPDGREDWILYHANSLPGQGCGKTRSPRAQQFTWRTDGTPDFGTPVKEGQSLTAPSSTSQTVSPKKDGTAKKYTNPLPVELGDPYVLKTKDGKYFMYGTSDVSINGFTAYSSADLVNWKAEGQVWFHNNSNGWSDNKATWDGAYWAPEVYERNGKYYLFYSAQWKYNPTKEKENFRIGVAVADKPTGPFIDVFKRPVFDPGYPIIDANVLFNDDGRIFLYYSRCCYKHSVKSEVSDWAKKKGWFKEIEESWVYGVELKPDFSGTIGKPVLLLRPPVSMKDKQAEWESRSVTAKEVNRRWTEGSVIFKKDSIYFIMYSANYFDGRNYAVGYATSRSPLGPFTKANNNPVLQKNIDSGGSVTGTGHNSITYSPDGNEMFCVYHGRTTTTGNKRVVFIDRMKILPGGKLVVEGPTTTPQKLPAAH